MLIVQKFHSIHEIDPEFISNLEILLQEDVPNFNVMIQKHDKAPDTDVFTFFLFFAPTQNTPIGFAQICLRKIPFKNFIPWYKKLCFWKKDHVHWKEVIWRVGDGNSGLLVIDPRYARTGKEKFVELIKEYDSRVEVMAQHFYSLKGLQDYTSTWAGEPEFIKETYVLEPLTKSFKSYQEYLENLSPDMKSLVKQNWKELHTLGKIELGDYPKPSETPKTIPIPEEQLLLWESWGAQILTFEKELKVLGCLVVLTGKNGNIFFEPFPFEPEGNTLVHDELYTQYALLKFFEMPGARKCHLMKFGSKFIFEDKGDLKFFQEQGFQLKTINQTFYSRLPGLHRPV